MTGSEPARARVVIVQDGRVALIKRVRDGTTYYIFPGGGVEDGETPAEAAVREAYEELGVHVRLSEHMRDEVFRGVRFHFFRAEIAGGEFGSGEWPDHADETPAAREQGGTHEPMWVPLEDLTRLDVRPPELAERLSL